MKKYGFILLLSLTFSVFAQNDKKVDYVEDGELIKATYYFENGSIEQEGTFNADGKLHGTWTSYDIDGNKVSIGEYHKGLRVGKWFFWTGETLREVDYFDSKIISVNEWTDKTRVAIRN